MKHRWFLGQWNYFMWYCNTGHVTYLAKPTEYTSQRVNFSVNYGLHLWICIDVDSSVVANQFNSVTQSCPTLCDPMNRSARGLPVHHQLLEFIQIHVHWVSDAIEPSHPLQDVMRIKSCMWSQGRNYVVTLFSAQFFS